MREHTIPNHMEKGSHISISPWVLLPYMGQHITGYLATLTRTMKLPHPNPPSIQLGPFLNIGCYMRDFPCGGITKTSIHAGKGPHNKPKEQLNWIPSCELLRALIGVTNGSVGEELLTGAGMMQNDEVTEKPTPSQVRTHRSSLPGELYTACRQLDRSEGLLSAPPLVRFPPQQVFTASFHDPVVMAREAVFTNPSSFNFPRHREVCLPPKSHEIFSLPLLERVFQIRRNCYMTTLH